MFPLFYKSAFFEIHAFGVLLICAWIVFFWLLHKYSTEHGLSKNIFGDIPGYTLSIFFWSRIFYILIDWRNEKYLFINFIESGGIIDFLRGFFITENYGLSLAGGVFGFLSMFLWKIFKEKAHFERSIDILVKSFFFAAIIGYIGTLLGGQIYGTPFDSMFSLLYNNKYSIVPIGSARFPLPIIYMLICVIGVFLLQRIQRTMKIPEGFLGYVGFGIYGIGLFLFEFMSGSSDMFASYFPYLGINQIMGLVFVVFSTLGIIKNIKL